MRCACCVVWNVNRHMVYKNGIISTIACGRCSFHNISISICRSHQMNATYTQSLKLCLICIFADWPIHLVFCRIASAAAHYIYSQQWPMNKKTNAYTKNHSNNRMKVCCVCENWMGRNAIRNQRISTKNNHPYKYVNLSELYISAEQPNCLHEDPRAIEVSFYSTLCIAQLCHTISLHKG